MSLAAVDDSSRVLVEYLDRELTPLVLSGSAGVDPKIWDIALTGLARELLSRPGKLFRARLVELSYSLAGGRDFSPHLALLVELLHAGSLIVDDIQDDSPTRRGGPALHVTHGMPLALNVGNWLYFAAFEIAGRLDLADAYLVDLYRSLSLCLFRCHQGQALDLAIDITAVRQREVALLAESAAKLKTGALVGFAAELGAIAAGASTAARSALNEFGEALGVGLQKLDDFGGLLNPKRAEKGLEDLACGRLTAVWGHLAETLDEIHFAGLQARLRRSQAERGGARREGIRAVASELREAVDDSGRQKISSELRKSLRSLVEYFPEHPTLTEIENEISRLESSYL